MPATLRQLDDEPHAAPIAPDLVPADWADCVPQPANDTASSRERLFAEIRDAAEAAAPKVDSEFRVTDAAGPVALDPSSRAWIRRAGTAFAIALVGVIGAAVWQNHGETATQAVASLIPATSAGASAAPEQPAVPPPPPVQLMDATQPATTAPAAAAVPLEAAQKMQTMARDLAAMTQQVEQLKAQIEALKANQQQAAVAPAQSAARAPAQKPSARRASTVPPRPIPMSPPRAAPAPAAPPTVQAAASPAASPPPAYQPPQPSPPQATTQPNGEPVVRPPMPMPLSDRY